MESEKKRVLLHLEEQYLSSLFLKYLEVHNFLVAECRQAPSLAEDVHQFSPHLLILGVQEEKSFDSAVSLVASLRSRHPQLSVMTVGYNLDHEKLKILMDSGITSHLDRRFSRPQDVVVMVKTLLSN